MVRALSRWWFRQSRASLLLIGGTLAIHLLAGIAAAAFLVETRLGYEGAAATSTQTLARLLQQSIASEVGRIDLSLQVTVDELERLQRRGLPRDDAALALFLERQCARQPAGSTIRVTDETGRVVAGTGVSATTRASWAERAFFGALRDGRDRGLKVTDPLLGAMSHEPIVAFVRRYDDARGGFAGVVSVAVPVAHFTALLGQAAVGPKGIVLLRDSTDALITRAPPSDNPAEQRGARRFSRQLQEAIRSGRPTETYFAAKTGDGIARIETYQRLSAVPFTLVVGRARSDFLAPWYRQVAWVAAFVAAFLGVSLLGAWRLRQEMKHAERAGQQARDLLRHASDGLHVLDATGRLVFVSDEFCAMLGYAREELVGRHASFWDAGLSPEALRHKIASQMASPARTQFETVHRRRDGQVFPVEVSGKPLDLFGERLLFCSSRDITERRTNQAQIAQALEDLHESQEIAEIGSYELDIQDGVWKSSAALDRLLGIDAGHDRTVAGWTELVAPEDRASMAAYFAREVVGGGQAFDREYRIVRPSDGACRWVHGRGRLIFGDDGRLRRMRGTIQDITERVQTQAHLRESEGRFRALVEQSVVAIYLIQDGVFRYVNPGFAKMHGFASPSEVIDRVRVEDLVGAADRERVLGQVALRMDGERQSAQYRFTGRRRDGSPLPLEVLGNAFHYDGRPAVIGIAIDISEREKAEADLRIAATAFQAQDGIMVTDGEGVIQRVNRAFTRITGYDEHEAVGRTPAQLQTGLQDPALRAGLEAGLLRDGYWQGELVNRHKDGHLFDERLTISAVKDPQGRVTHHVGWLVDITRQREAESKVERLANFDALTDLPNRSLLQDRLTHAMATSARSGSHCALVFADIDHFKKVNDTIGHHAGDQLLVQAAQRMRAAVRECDTVARFGGDEFVVLLEDLGRDVHEAGRRAARIADKLLASMSGLYELGGQPFYCTASLGAALFVGGADSAETILRHADLAMYRAKQDGRNALRFFEDRMQVELAQRTALESELREALAARQFVLHYQPQFDRAGRLVGAEALLRWRHPTRGLLLPGAFIGLAEETGFIVPLGRWVLDAACAQIAAWARSEATRHLVVAVNASARQFAQADFVDGVLASLAAAGALPSRLKIELTESTVVVNVQGAFDKMRALKAHGIAFSLDDFGTGSSSLSYLTRLPLDELKIDKSFVDDLPHDGQDAMVAQTIIAMGKGLGLNVVAEGVETEAQWSFLMRNGCDAFQGYHFGRPMGVGEFEALVGTRCQPA